MIPDKTNDSSSWERISTSVNQCRTNGLRKISESLCSRLFLSLRTTRNQRFSSQIGHVQWEKDPSGLLCSCFSCTVSWCPSLSVVDVFGVFAGQMLLQQCHCVHSLSLQAQALDEWIVCTVVQTAQSLLSQKRKQPGRGANSRQIMCISFII